MKIRNYLLSSCLIAALCSCGTSQKENLNLTLSKDTLFDKVKGAWAGQILGCTYGGPTEFQYLSTIIPDSVVMSWGNGEIKKWFDGGGGLYDDVYVDLTFVETFERCGLDAPVDSFAAAFLAKEYPLCHANQQARYNLLQGLSPHASGYWKNNPHANCLDFQIEADFAGIMSPGMVNSAVDFCDRIGHIMAYGDGWYGGVYVAAMYSLAYVSDDIEYIVTEGLKAIPQQSRFYACMTDVINWHKQYPDDWKKCWEEIEKKWGTNDIACPDGIEVPFNIETYVNGAYIILGLLYGQGDFEKTIDISTRAGQDSDCTPATAAGILGVIQGYKAIPEYWKPALERCENIKFPYTDISLSSVYDINLKLLSDVLKANGGKIKGDKYYTTIQKPKTVAWEVSFEGLYPSERRVIKYDLGTEKTFEFNGKGVVLMGMIRQDVKDSNDNYIAILEAYIDGKKVETIEMPYDYIKRKYDIFYNYDLEEGPHKLVIKWINPNEKYAVQCKDMVVYSSIPAEPINPYK